MEKAADLMDLTIQHLLQDCDSARLEPGVDVRIVADDRLQGLHAVVLLEHGVELYSVGGTSSGCEGFVSQIFASQWTCNRKKIVHRDIIICILINSVVEPESEPAEAGLFSWSR